MLNLIFFSNQVYENDDCNLQIDCNRFIIIGNTLDAILSTYRSRVEFRRQRKTESLVEREFMKSIRELNMNVVMNTTTLSSNDTKSLLSPMNHLPSLHLTNNAAANTALPRIDEIEEILREDVDYNPLLITSVKRSKREHQRLRREISERRRRKLDKLHQLNKTTGVFSNVDIVAYEDSFDGFNSLSQRS
jgi:hypothetical protein